MRCKFCGSELPEDTTICPDCGMNLVSESLSEQKIETIHDDDSGKDPGKVLGLIAMILGIVAAGLALISCGCCCCTYTMLLGIITMGISVIAGIVGFILGLIASSKSKAAGFKNTNATLGIILSIAAIALFVVSIILAIVLFATGLGLGFFAVFLGEGM